MNVLLAIVVFLTVRLKATALLFTVIPPKTPPVAKFKEYELFAMTTFSTSVEEDAAWTIRIGERTCLSTVLDPPLLVKMVSRTVRELPEELAWPITVPRL
ncbi:hypothetical protein ABNQ39_35735 (plasmid) [Azospirillum sp. A26]|uniref:hypothetical protein n=1 Tax=Azospirillum sp. A26 TaxID=3160607 RepID=UPI00366D3364